MLGPCIPHEFVTLQAEAFRSINKDNSEKGLVKGIWYPIEYFDVLRQHPQERQGTRIEWMRTQNICYRGHVPLEFFNRHEGHIFTFSAKTDVVASKALTQLTEGLAFLECSTAVQLTQWIALRDYIGSERFNVLLSLPSNEFSPLYLQHGAHILTCLYQHVKIRGEEEVQAGDLCYFKNISKYPKKHPFGPAEGYNTVCVVANRRFEEHNETKFMGFGLPKDGASSSEIESHLFNEYNKESLKPQDYMSEEQALEYDQPSIKGSLTGDEFEREPSEHQNGINGRLALKILRPRFDRLEALKKIPPDKIRELIASWC